MENDNDAIINRIKKNYDIKNYNDVLSDVEYMLKNQLYNLFVLKIGIDVYMKFKDSKKTLELINICINVFNEYNLFLTKLRVLLEMENKIKQEIRETIIKIFAHNLCDQKDLHAMICTFMINSTNIIETHNFFEYLLNKDIIDNEKYEEYLVSTIFKSSIQPLELINSLHNFIKSQFKINENITDEILFDILENRHNLTKFEKIIFLYLLTEPKILFDNTDDIKKNSDKMLYNLEKLTNILKNNPIFESPDDLIASSFNSYFYYNVYSGLNNVELYQKVSKLFRAMCKNLDYRSKYLNENNLYKKKNKTHHKIKIGFLSNYLVENHSVCRDRIGVIQSLINDDRFDVYIFFYDKEKAEIYNKIIGTTNFKNEILLPLNNNRECSIQKSRDIIENTKLDIIVYPELGMNVMYYLLAHYRLAPIQINTWGHSETSGIDTIDYYFSSKYYEDETNQDKYSEQLVRLNSLCTYYYKLDIFHQDSNVNDKDLNFEIFGLSEKCNLYGVLQTVFKYHPSHIQMIREVLLKDPKAVIIYLNYEGLEKRFFKYLEKHLGYHINRVKLFNRFKVNEYMRLLYTMDIILDSYPFGGCNTSFEAFHCGKIVITLPSDKLNGRFTCGFYKKMGIEEPVCKDMNEYVEKAIFYANNKEEKLKLETKILENKHKLFEEKDSTETWKLKLLELHYNKNNKSKQDIIENTLYDIVVVGSSLSGIIMAERFANRFNKKVLLLEKRDKLGGSFINTSLETNDELDMFKNIKQTYGINLVETNVEKVIPYLSSFTDFTKSEHINGYNYVPTKGYTELLERILCNGNINIILNTDYNDVKEFIPKNKTIFYSGLVDDYFKDSTLSKLEYRTVHFENNDNIDDSTYLVPTSANNKLYEDYKNLMKNEESNNVYFIGRQGSYNFDVGKSILDTLELFNNISTNKFEIVVSIEENHKEPILLDNNNYKIYSKVNENPSNLENYITLANIGKETHTYLHHIIENYDKLAESTIFTHGKYINSTLENIKHFLTSNKSGYIPFSSECNYLNVDEKGIMIHCGTWLEDINSGKMKKAKINFIDWWKKYIKTDLKNFSYTPMSVFSVKRENILKHPKQFYVDLINQLDHENPEEVHYMERAWKTIFQ